MLPMVAWVWPSCKLNWSYSCSSGLLLGVLCMMAVLVLKTSIFEPKATGFSRARKYITIFLLPLTFSGRLWANFHNKIADVCPCRIGLAQASPDCHVDNYRTKAGLAVLIKTLHVIVIDPLGQGWTMQAVHFDQKSPNLLKGAQMFLQGFEQSCAGRFRHRLLRWYQPRETLH